MRACTTTSTENHITCLQARAVRILFEDTQVVAAAGWKSQQHVADPVLSSTRVHPAAYHVASILTALLSTVTIGCC